MMRRFGKAGWFCDYPGGWTLRLWGRVVIVRWRHYVSDSIALVGISRRRVGAVEILTGAAPCPRR